MVYKTNKLSPKKILLLGYCYTANYFLFTLLTPLSPSTIHNFVNKFLNINHPVLIFQTLAK